MSDLASRIRRQVDVSVNRALDAGAVRKRVAEYARGELAAMIAAGTFSPVYTRFVNHVRGAPEESVSLDGGTIDYLASYLFEAVFFALSYVRTRSVVGSDKHSGDYRDGWAVIVDGGFWLGDLAAIPPGSEVAIVNVTPYNRKIDVGAQITRSVHIVENARQAVQRRYQALHTRRQFILLPSGNYVLKGRAVRSGLSFNPKTGQWLRLHAPRLTRRADSRAGEPLTYPALVMTEASI